MKLELREYQKESLEVLREYLRKSSELNDAHAAFETVRRARRIRTSSYLNIEGYPDLANIPYVCLRIPTGGGKTLIASHACGVIAEELLRTENPIILWLAPSTTIRDQTLKALRNRNHPYYEAVSDYFDTINVLNFDEALRVQRGMLDAGATIIVASVQAIRVTDKELRKAYASHGGLMEHFQGELDPAYQPLQKREDGSFPYSFANVLRKRRPIVIVDEAHGVRTELSFETLANFAPSCILELTATPHQGDRTGRGKSNVLYTASAYALKSADMIKMPIVLRMLQDWPQTVNEALKQQVKLDEACKQHEKTTKEFIRPIILFQAQRNVQGENNITPKALQDWLVDNEKFKSRDECPIVTGSVDELGDRNIMDKDSSIRAVITQQKLKEGWDCSWAYIICTIAPSGTATATEQILGRVMRMPGAKRKNDETLNMAYAYSMGTKFLEVRENIIKGLVDIGFEKWHAEDMVAADAGEQTEIEDDTFFKPATTETIKVDTPLKIPMLCEEESGLFEPIDATQLLDTEWTTADFDHEMTEKEYSPTIPKIEEGVVDVSKEGKLTFQQVAGIQLQIDRLNEQRWSEADLTRWLVKQARSQWIPADQMMRYVRFILSDLKKRRGYTEAELITDRHHLRDAVIEKVNSEIRKLKQKNLQSLLNLDGSKRVVTSPEAVFVFDQAEPYRCNDKYEGPIQFKKHLYSWIGDMNREEAECALILDKMAEVECWVRNPVRQGFRLPTSSDFFYPDFVARLKDGRYLVVEYKGAVDWTNADSIEKRTVGDAWAQLSEGTCLFVMPGGPSNLENEILYTIKQGLTSTTDGGQIRIN